jgi:hypothetical protein
MWTVWKPQHLDHGGLWTEGPKARRGLEAADGPVIV